MYLFGVGFKKTIKKETIDIYINRLTPFLNHGSILLVSNFQNMLALISPTQVKHTGFVYKTDQGISIIELNEHSELKIVTLYDFLKTRSTVFVVDYYDKELMSKTMNYIFDYKDVRYGFFSDEQEYCYKIIYTLYNKALGGTYKKMSDFWPVFKLFGGEFANSKSIFLSRKFKVICGIVNGVFFKAGNKLTT